VYMHVGFVPQGVYNFVRRGPAVVRGLEAEEGTDGNGQEKKLEEVSVEAVARELEAHPAI
jgi:hypothetical protein